MDPGGLFLGSGPLRGASRMWTLRTPVQPVGNDQEAHLFGAETSLPTPQRFSPKTGLRFPGIYFQQWTLSLYEQLLCSYNCSMNHCSAKKVVPCLVEQKWESSPSALFPLL